MIEQHAFPEIAKLIAQGAEVRSGMNHMLGFCAKRLPHPMWDKVRQLDYREDLTYLRQWLGEVLAASPPAPEINAFWFGLYNPIDESGNATSGLYVAGSTRFHGTNGSIDWAVRPEYFPAGRYARSTVLSDIHRLAYEDDEDQVSAAEYALCPAYSALALMHLVKVIGPDPLRGAAPRRAITTGFDDGDWLVVGTLRPDGFNPAKRQL